MEHQRQEYRGCTGRAAGIAGKYPGFSRRKAAGGAPFDQPGAPVAAQCKRPCAGGPSRKSTRIEDIGKLVRMTRSRKPNSTASKPAKARAARPRSGYWVL